MSSLEKVGSAIKGAAAGFVGLKTKRFKSQLLSDGVYSEIEKMKDKMRKQIKKYKESIGEIEKEEKTLKEIKTEMNRRTDKLEDMANKMEELM
jgi:seryl-tRNA synthetase